MESLPEPQLPIYVINLDRRPDRLAFVARQLDDMDLVWTRFSAFDVQTTPREWLLPHVDAEHLMLRMSGGSQCCLLSNLHVWKEIASSDLPGAIILQDDVTLSPKLADFARSHGWIPEGFDLVQFEKYGRKRSKRLMGSSPLWSPVPTVELRELHSRTGGAGAYFISRAGAQRAIQACEGIRFPIDHYLFNPNISPLARRFRIAMTRPSLARQCNDELGSDIQRADNIRSFRAAAVRAWHEVNLLPRQIAGLLFGRVRLLPVWYQDR